MSKNSGFLCEIQGGGKAIVRHSEQRKEFADLKKRFIHYLDDEFNPIMENGKEKTGLKDIDKLKMIGYVD